MSPPKWRWRCRRPRPSKWSWRQRRRQNLWHRRLRRTCGPAAAPRRAQDPPDEESRCHRRGEGARDEGADGGREARGDGKADAVPPGGQVEGGGEPGRQEDCREEEHGQEGGPQKAPVRKKKPAGDTPAGYIRELVAGAGAEGIMLSTITDALRAKFKDFKVRDLGYSQMRQYMASVGDYELEKSGRNFRVRLSQ